MYDLFCASVFFHQLLSMKLYANYLGVGLGYTSMGYMRIGNYMYVHACNTGKMFGIAVTITTCCGGDDIPTYMYMCKYIRGFQFSVL